MTKIFENKKDIKTFIVLALLAMSGIGVINNCCGVFYSAMAASLDVKRGSVTLYMTILSLVSSITAVYTPKLITQKNYKKAIGGCNILCALSLVLIGQAKSLYQIYLIACVAGFAEAFFSNAVINLLISNNIDSNIGKISSVIYLFSGIIGIALSPLLTLIIENYNYSAGYLVSAILSFVFALPIWFTDLKVDFKDKKEESGNAVASHSKLLVPVYAIMSCIFYTVSVFPQHFIGYGTLRGLSSLEASYLLSASMAGNVLFKIINGSLADKIGSIRTSFLIAITNLAGILMLAVSKSYGIMLFACFIYGSNFTMTSFMHSLLCRDLFSSSYFKTYPLMMFAGAIAYSLSSSLIGYCYDFTGSYDIVIRLIIAFDIFDIISFIFLDRRQKSLKTN